MVEGWCPLFWNQEEEEVAQSEGI